MPRIDLKKILISLLLLSFIWSSFGKTAYGVNYNKTKIASELELTWEKSSTNFYKRDDILKAKNVLAKHVTMITAGIVGITVSVAGAPFTGGASAACVAGATIPVIISSIEIVRQACEISEVNLVSQATSDLKSYRVIKDAKLFLLNLPNKGRFDTFFEKNFESEGLSYTKIEVAKTIDYLNKEAKLGVFKAKKGHELFRMFNREKIKRLVIDEIESF